MTLTQVKKLLTKEQNESNEDYDFNDFMLGGSQNKEITTKDGVKIKFVGQDGEAHDGATLKTIIEIDGKNYAAPWVYSSWDGSEIYFEDLYEVKHKEVTQKKWVAV